MASASHLTIYHNLEIPLYIYIYIEIGSVWTFSVLKNSISNDLTEATVAFLLKGKTLFEIINYVLKKSFQGTKPTKTIASLFPKCSDTSRLLRATNPLCLHGLKL